MIFYNHDDVWWVPSRQWIVVVQHPRVTLVSKMILTNNSKRPELRIRGSVFHSYANILLLRNSYRLEKGKYVVITECKRPEKMSDVN